MHAVPQERQTQLHFRELLTSEMNALLSPQAALRDMSDSKDSAVALLRRGAAMAPSSADSLSDVQLLCWLLDAQVRSWVA